MVLHKRRPVAHQTSIGEAESNSNELTSTRDTPPTAGAGAAGAVAVGALAIGALAIGALVIGRLVIARARIRRLEIDELVVGKLRVTDSVKMPSTPGASRDNTF